MDFTKFEAKVVKNNRILWISLAVSILISSITLFLVLARQKYFVVSNGEIFKERPLVEDVCLESFIGMAKGEPNSNFISDGIMKIVKQEPFELEVENVLRVKSLEKGKCQIIVKSDGKLRSFLLGLIESDKNPFYYKLNQLDEIETKEEL